MGAGAAIALAGGAVALVYFLTKSQEARTAAMIQQQTARIPQHTSGEPYALSIQDQFTVGATILATYFGGASNGAKVATALAPQ